MKIFDLSMIQDAEVHTLWFIYANVFDDEKTNLSMKIGPCISFESLAHQIYSNFPQSFPTIELIEQEMFAVHNLNKSKTENNTKIPYPLSVFLESFDHTDTTPLF